MTSAPDEAELLSLVNDALEGQASPTQLSRLHERLTSSAVARQVYIDHVLMRTLLVQIGGGHQSADDANPSDEISVTETTAAETELLALAAAEARSGSAVHHRRKADRRAFKRFWLAAATIILAIGTVAVLLKPRANPPVAIVPPVPTTSATLTGILDAQWGANEMPVREQRLITSHVHDLTSGLARIAFDDGATAIIEGPARFSIIGPGAIKLEGGKLVALAEGRARGFSVVTAQATITDRGTEFAVRASAAGASDVYVIRGRVTFQATSASSETRPTEIGAGEARKASSGGNVKSIPSDITGFVRPEQFAARLTLPAGWTDADIGSPRLSGLAEYDASARIWKVIGGGADLWGVHDEFHFANTRVDGDLTVIVHVDSLSNTGDHAKAGLMIRDGADDDARYAHVFVTPVTGKQFQGVIFECRDDPGAAAHGVDWGGDRPAPLWLKLVRSGSNFSAFYSDDGSDWVQIGPSRKILIGPTADVGLVAAANSKSATTTAVFSGLSLSH